MIMLSVNFVYCVLCIFFGKSVTCKILFVGRWRESVTIVCNHNHTKMLLLNVGRICIDHAAQKLQNETNMDPINTNANCAAWSEFLREHPTCVSPSGVWANAVCSQRELRRM